MSRKVMQKWAARADIKLRATVQSVMEQPPYCNYTASCRLLCLSDLDLFHNKLAIPPYQFHSDIAAGSCVIPW